MVLAILEECKPCFELCLYNINILQLQYGFYLWMSMMMICLCMLWIVFLIILLCIWSITSHCTNSYWEIQLSLYFLEREAISLLVFMIIVTLIWNFVLYLMLYSSCGLSCSSDFTPACLFSNVLIFLYFLYDTNLVFW